jgi:hypothetical protein
MKSQLQALNDTLGKLEALGSADQIADFFRQERIRGHKKGLWSCPVARYLYREVNAPVWVGPERGHQGLAGLDVMLCTVETNLPDHVNEFALKFDEGVYGDLIY